MKRGEEIPRPNPWTFKAVSSDAAKGWVDLCRHAPGPIDEAWVRITGNPRHVSMRQHQLRGKLSTYRCGGLDLEQWQYEVTGAGRLWYAIDDEARTLWLVWAGTGHPRQTGR
jgi:hypothetical protein